MKRKGLFLLGILIVGIGLIGFNFATSTCVLAKQLPKVTKATTHPEGGLGYAASAGLVMAIEQKEGIKVRIVSHGSDIARLMDVRTGDAAFSITGGGTFFAVNGMQAFSVEEWGPQPLRLIWAGEAVVGYFVRGDSDIKTANDLKGTRVPYYPGAPSVTKLAQGWLSFAGLTWNDVKKINFGGAGPSYKGIIEGAVDGAPCCTTGSKCYELEGGPHGIHWIPLPPTDKQGWARLMKVIPYVGPKKVEVGRGAGLAAGSPENPLWSFSYAFAFPSYPRIDADLVYHLTKGIWEGYDIYKNTHPELPFWTREIALNYKAQSAPYHEGAVRLFKEKGVWTAEMEQWQKNMISLEKKRMKGWEEAQAAAKKQKIRVGRKGWKEFWEKWLEEKNLMARPAQYYDYVK